MNDGNLIGVYISFIYTYSTVQYSAVQYINRYVLYMHLPASWSWVDKEEKEIFICSIWAMEYVGR